MEDQLRARNEAALTGQDEFEATPGCKSFVFLDKIRFAPKYSARDWQVYIYITCQLLPYAGVVTRGRRPQ